MKRKEGGKQVKKFNVKKAVLLIVMLSVVAVIILFYQEKEIVVTYVGSREDVINLPYFYSTEAEYYISEEEVRLFSDKYEVDLSEYSIDYSDNYLLIVYGRKLEDLRAGPSNFIYYKWSPLVRDFVFTFSEDYYPNTIFLYQIKAGDYSGNSSAPYGNCYLLLNNGKRIYIGDWNALDSERIVQEAIENAK